MKENTYDLYNILAIEKKLLNIAKSKLSDLMKKAKPIEYSTYTNYYDQCNQRNNQPIQSVKLLQDIQKWQDIIDVQEEKIKCIKREINDIHQLINNLTGLKYKVEYMKQESCIMKLYPLN